jgi:hypothetical protein
MIHPTHSVWPRMHRRTPLLFLGDHAGALGRHSSCVSAHARARLREYSGGNWTAIIVRSSVEAKLLAIIDLELRKRGTGTRDHSLSDTVVYPADQPSG